MDDLQIEQADAVKDLAPVAGIKRLAELYERRGEVVCFTPALLVVVGKLPVDPVREFATRFPTAKDQQPFCLALPAHGPSFFAGIGVSHLNGDVIDWDRRLYGISKDRATACFNFLGGIGIHGDDYFASAVQHEIQLPDPLAVLTRSTLPVQVFGVMVNNRVFYLAEDLAGPPHLAYTTIEKIGNAAFSVNPDHAAIAKKMEDTL